VIDGREFCGSLVYVAPEICSKKDYGKQVDMWSAGIIFYNLVFGELPFVGFDEKSTIQMIIHNKIQINKKDITNSSIDLILKMLDKDPSTRITPIKAL
jgi:calcium-dependent protein kinase